MESHQPEFNWYKPELGAGSKPSRLNIEVPRTPQQQRFQLRLQRHENPLQDPSSRRKKYTHVAEKILSDSERIVSRSKQLGNKPIEKRISCWKFFFPGDNESDLQHYLKSSRCRKLFKISIVVLALVGLTMNMTQLDLLLRRENNNDPVTFEGVPSRETKKGSPFWTNILNTKDPIPPSPLDFDYQANAEGRPNKVPADHNSPQDVHDENRLHENDKNGGYMTDSGQVITDLRDIDPLVPQFIDQEEPLVVSDETNTSTLNEANEHSEIQSEAEAEAETIQAEEVIPNVAARDNIAPSNQSQESPLTTKYESKGESSSPKQFIDLDGFFDEWPIFDQAPIEDVPIQYETEIITDEFADTSNQESLIAPSSLSQSSLAGLEGLPKVNPDGSVPLDELGNFKDNTDPWDSKEVPIFLHIPKAGGSTVKDIMGTCHRFTMATETGILDGHVDDPVSLILYASQ